MISFTVRMSFNAEDHDDINRCLLELTQSSRQEPGCVNYIAHWVDGEANTVLIYEQYRDEAAVEHHRGTPHFARYAIGGLYQKMLQRSVEALDAIS